MDWHTFYSHTEELLRTKLSLQKVEGVLLLLDQDVLSAYSSCGRLALKLFAFYSQALRGRFLKPLFLKIKRNQHFIFQTAPHEAIESYNALIKRLFSKKNAEALVVTVSGQLKKVEETLPKQKEPNQEEQEKAKQERIKKLTEALEKPLTQFQKELKAVDPGLQKIVVEPLIARIKSEIGEGKKNLDEFLKEIESQKKEILLLDQEIFNELTETKKTNLEYSGKLFSKEFQNYPELLKAARELVNEAYQFPEISISYINEEERKRLLDYVKEFCASQVTKVKSLVERGKSLNKKIAEVLAFQEGFLKAIEQFKKYKDLKPLSDSLLKEVKDFSITTNQFRKLSQREIEEVVEGCFEKYMILKMKCPELFAKAEVEMKRAEFEVCSSKRTLKRRLFEIFTKLTPYPELKDELEKLKNFLTKELMKLDQNFFTGAVSAEEHREACFGLAYDHDVLLLRGELEFRATRLRELREENHRLLREMLDVRRFLEAIKFERSERLYIEAAALVKTLFELLHRIENPFEIFKEAFAFENVNQTFRHLWVEMESLAEKVKGLETKVEPIFKEKAEVLKRQFFKVLNDLEEVLKDEKGTRPSILIPVDEMLQHVSQENLWEALNTQMHDIEERFSFIKPLSFFLNIDDFRQRDILLRQARLIDEQVEETFSFAKSLQYIKTFEEERVDDILEALERNHVIEDLQKEEIEAKWNNYVAYMQKALYIVKEEVLLDIGLLDQKALFDVEEERLEKTLHPAVVKAKKHLEVSPYLEALNPLLSKAHPNTLVELTLKKLQMDALSWQKRDFPKKEKSSFWLSELRLFCALLFDLKAIFLTQKRNKSAHFLFITDQVRHYSQMQKSEIERLRKAQSFEGSVPAIKEFDEIKVEIEKLEIADEKVSLFQDIIDSIFQKIEQISEIKKQSEEAKEAIQKFQKELAEELSQISIFTQGDQIKHPLHYIPGFLEYFHAK